MQNEVKNCSKYHGPILPIDLPGQEEEPGPSQQISDTSDSARSEDKTVEGTAETKASGSLGTIDVDMKGISAMEDLTTVSLRLKASCLKVL